MELLNTLKSHIMQLDSKAFLAYLGGFLLGVLLMIGGLYYYYSSATEDYTTQIEELNGKREELRTLFEQETRLEKQETEVNKLLKEDVHFRIADFFQDITKKLNLTPAEAEPEETLQPGGKYKEYTLLGRFQAIDMKQICELLEEIEKNKRVYTKSLDILRSKSTPTKLDATLIIGTLREAQGT